MKAPILPHMSDSRIPTHVKLDGLDGLDARLTWAVEQRDPSAAVRTLRDLRAALPATWIDEARRIRASVDERAGSFLMSHVAACIFFEDADDDLAIEAIQRGAGRADRAREVGDEPS